MSESPVIDIPANPETAPTSEMKLQAVIASYSSHEDAEKTICQLAQGGFPVEKISIIGRHFEIREDVKGYRHPGNATREGAGFGAMWGGVFGLLAGAGILVLPVLTPIVILGELAAIAVSALGGAGLGALVGGLVFMGVDQRDAVKYEEHIQAGEFLLVIHGASPEEMDQARAILSGTKQNFLHTHSIPRDAR